MKFTFLNRQIADLLLAGLNTPCFLTQPGVMKHSSISNSRAYLAVSGLVIVPNKKK